MKSFLAKNEEVQQKWLLVDANGAILGRLATKLATILMGKHKPTYTPNVDTGDYVIVLNAEKIKLTGNKKKRNCMIIILFIRVVINISHSLRCWPKIRKRLLSLRLRECFPRALWAIECSRN
jgi:ribosomal protein L13